MDFNNRSFARLHRTEGMRHAAHEGIEDREVKFAAADSWAIHSNPNLLLMMPALGILAGDVEPVRRGFFSRPTDSPERRRVGIESAEELVHFLRGDLDQIDQNSRTQATRCLYPLGIIAIDKSDEGFIAPVRRSLPQGSSW